MFFLVLISYSIIGIFLLSVFKYQMNPDGISYLSIAQKYLNGDFLDAINGYWSPLYSWLLVPFLYLNIQPTIAAKLLSLSIGLFTLVGARLLSYAFNMSEKIRFVILFSLVPATLYFAFTVISPDLLVSCILLFYLAIIFTPDYELKPFEGMTCGIIGGTAYLAKCYALPFFLVHFIVVNLFYYYRTKNKEILLRHLSLGLATFIFISGIWISLISSKYNFFTIGTAANFNYAISGPEYKGRSVWSGFIKPTNKSATSWWEDPSFISVKTQVHTNSWHTFKYRFRVFVMNIYDTYLHCILFFPFSLVIIIVLIIFCISSKDMPLSMFSLFTILLYPLGYLPIFIVERYLWFLYILLLLMGGHVSQFIFTNEFFRRELIKNAFLVFFALSFILIPIKNIVKGSFNGRHQFLYELSMILKNQYHIKGKIASNDWGQTLTLSYFLNSQFYGMPSKDWCSDDLEKNLKINEIKYYFFWEDNKLALKPLNYYAELTGDKIAGLKIFLLRPN